MRYWPEISFRYSQSEVNRKAEVKVNIFPKTTDTGSAVNFARCTRVLRKSDSCSGEKLMNNMSAMQNSSTTARTCSTRELSWAEDFIDLSEFCQPSTTRTRMEDCVDECLGSPGTVSTRGLDNGLDVDDGLDPNLEEPLWFMPSPNTIQEELCDPITDWLAATKETMNSSTSNNDNLLISSRTEISSDLNDIFLNPSLTSVPNATSLYDEKSIVFGPDDSQTPPLQSDITFFHSSPDAATTTASVNHHQNCGSAEALNGSLLRESSKIHTIVHLPPADLLFKEKQSLLTPQPPPPPLPSISTLVSVSAASPSVVTPLSTSTQPSSLCNVSNSFQLRLPGRNQFLECKTSMATQTGSQVTVNANALFPCSLQSPSVSQPSATNSSHESEPEHQLPSVAVCTSGQVSRTTTSKSAMINSQSAANTSTSPCSINPPEMLNPLVNKNAEFDLVSYVFEDNKPSVSFDLSNLSSNSKEDEQMMAKINSTSVTTSVQAVTIKTEPKDESSSLVTDANSITKSSYHLKRSFKDEDEEDNVSVDGSSCSSVKFKRSRRFSNCSSEDLTQLESEKYRELRNKNNEASRRSRANRKNREVEMREHAFKLDAENRRLKFKAEEMEKLVKRLRHCLMQLVLKKG